MLQTQKEQVVCKFTAEKRKWDDAYHQNDYDSLGVQWRQASGVRLCHRNVRVGGRILDMGCGGGHASTELARLGFEVVGLDIAGSMVAQARANAEILGLSEACSFVVGDLETDAPSLGKFDGLLGLGFIEYFDDPCAVLRICRELLQPQGVAVIQVWNPRSLARSLFDPVLIRARLLLHPIQFARRKILGPHPAGNSKRHNTIRSSPEADEVEHRKYTPRQIEKLSGDAGLVPVASSGTLFFSRRTPLPAAVKRSLEIGLQHLSRVLPVIRRGATDYVVGLRRPSP